MRGIPWNAVSQNLTIKGTHYRASEIADMKNPSGFSNIMEGVDLSKPGAQEYYNSLFELYAEWGVDYVKVDDMLVTYHAEDIKAVHKAIKNSKRDIVYSLSPGDAPIEKTEHLVQNANLWRISDDFWDHWKKLKEQFFLCPKW